MIPHINMLGFPTEEEEEDVDEDSNEVELEDVKLAHK